MTFTSSEKIKKAKEDDADFIRKFFGGLVKEVNKIDKAEEKLKQKHPGLFPKWKI